MNNSDMDVSLPVCIVSFEECCICLGQINVFKVLPGSFNRDCIDDLSLQVQQYDQLKQFMV